MKRIVLAFIATAAMGSALAQAPAAPKPRVLVQATSGTVQVGDSVVALDTSAGANLGETISVVDGSALVTYPDGCVITVTQSTQVAAISPCKAGLVKSSTVPASNKGLAIALGVGGAVILGVAAGGGGSDDRPSSP